jgi:arylsulfatase A-like enzyme
MMSKFILILITVHMLFTFTCCAEQVNKENNEKSRPNIIFMLADDLGYGDLNTYNPNAEGRAPNNTPIHTPNLNSMAKDGVRFTDFHSAAPICSPSRRALLTARYQSRLGQWAEGYNGSKFPGVRAELDPTIGIWLKQAGYATATYGKWNIGETLGVSWPSAHGFDDWLIIDHNTGYFQHKNKNGNCKGRPMLFETGGHRVTNLEGEYLTDIWADKAIEFIEAQDNKPFFIYLPWSVPHGPLQDPASSPSTAFDGGAKANTPEGRVAYVNMVEHLDSRIGKIFQTLKKRGEMDNTLIIFTSDNGGMTSGNSWPLKKSKQWLEEGGIRVPCLMQWGNELPKGEVTKQLSIMMDASVTVLAAADALKYVPKDRQLDGMDLLPILKGKSQEINDRELGWRRRTWGANKNYLRQEAYRIGDWKLLRSYKYMGSATYSDKYKEELFNLNEDVGETTDLSNIMPEKLAGMKEAFEQWKEATVESEPAFQLSFPDQTGSPYIDPAVIFDFEEGVLFNGTWSGIKENGGKLIEMGVVNGAYRMQVHGGLSSPMPTIYRHFSVDTDRFKRMRIRMKVTSEGAATCKPAKVMLRNIAWRGQDLPFPAQVDGEWHEYEIDVIKSKSWGNWAKDGRIGLTLPEPKQGSITVDVDFMKLEE